MEVYKVGQVVEKFKNHAEEVLFDVTDEGANLLVFFNNPTENEIKQFDFGNNFEIRLTELYDVMMFTFKIGSLNWMDAPYSPHLSLNLTTLQMSEKSQGLGLTLFLINAINGKIEHIRFLGLSQEFTEYVFVTIKRQIASEFDVLKYQMSLNKIFETYSTNQIMQMSDFYCKFE